MAGIPNVLATAPCRSSATCEPSVETELKVGRAIARRYRGALQKLAR
jgi:hypothetical protein